VVVGVKGEAGPKVEVYEGPRASRTSHKRRGQAGVSAGGGGYGI